MSITQPVSKNIGLALSGGAARGIAHLGIIEALAEIGYKPSAISGVSSGAIVGSLYANGYSPRECLEIIKKTSIIKAIRPAFNIGLLHMDKAEKILSQYLQITQIEDLPIPLYISACNIINGEYITFNSGDLIKAVIASSSIPMLFKPVHYNNMQLVDGGIMNNMPVDPLKNCKFIIGANVNIIDPEIEVASFYMDVERSLDLIVTTNIKESIKACHLFIEPPRMKYIRIKDINRADEIFEIGYTYTLKMHDQIRKAIEATE